MTALAGYSTRGLGAKLGLKPGMRARFINAPPSVLRELAAERSVLTETGPRATKLDFMHWFVEKPSDVGRDFPKHKARLAENGMLWVSWRKGGAKAIPPAAVTEKLVRDTGLDTGLVDIKICAVDEVWSGLKFVYRLSERGGAKK
jgi:hypothetical protein